MLRFAPLPAPGAAFAGTGGGAGGEPRRRGARAGADEPQSAADWAGYIGATLAHNDYSPVPADYGLASIAAFLGEDQSAALQHARDAAAAEASGDVAVAIKLYNAAYRGWPGLDSVISGGLPKGARADAAAAGYCGPLLTVVDVGKARASRVVAGRRWFGAADVAALGAVRDAVLSTTSEDDNNPQNARHHCKKACMMNDPPRFALQALEPRLLGTVLRFAARAWEEGGWGEPGGPLEHVVGGLGSLSVRVVEYWEYEVGGSLIDDFHYDVDSIVTIVVLLSAAGDFEGGEFRTCEPDGSHQVHAMDQGDIIAFCSHKYHNVTEVRRGGRRSLVTELWEGGVGHTGR